MYHARTVATTGLSSKTSPVRINYCSLTAVNICAPHRASDCDPSVMCPVPADIVSTSIVSAGIVSAGTVEILLY
jgi:hypothetical protein